MVKRDLIRNVIFLSVIAITIVCLRIFIFTPYSITTKDANHFLQEKDVVIANKNEQIKRDDFVLYEVKGKKHVGRIIGVGNDSVVYMILNDNRQNMEDSRKFGLISKKQIKGVISFRVLPLQEFGFIKTK